MKNKLIYKEIEEVKAVSTAHLSGMKQILLNKDETESSLTQVAVGVLQPGEIVENHLHYDMEESFYFLEGKGVYQIDGKQFSIGSGTYIHIPRNTEHLLKAEGKTPLKFIYWGIET